MDELSNLDDVEFLLCDRLSPGAFLKKDGHVVWAPIAARTRSRVSRKDSYTITSFKLTLILVYFK